MLSFIKRIPIKHLKGKKKESISTVRKLEHMWGHSEPRSLSLSCLLEYASDIVLHLLQETYSSSFVSLVLIMDKFYNEKTWQSCFEGRMNHAFGHFSVHISFPGTPVKDLA